MKNVCDNDTIIKNVDLVQDWLNIGEITKLKQNTSLDHTVHYGTQMKLSR